MSQAQDKAAAALDALINSEETELFTPIIYVKKGGDIGASLKVQGAWGSISIETFAKIAKNMNAAMAAAVKAGQMRKDPEAVKACREAHAAKQASGKKAATTTVVSKPAVTAELDALI